MCGRGKGSAARGIPAGKPDATFRGRIANLAARATGSGPAQVRPAHWGSRTADRPASRLTTPAPRLVWSREASRPVPPTGARGLMRARRETMPMTAIEARAWPLYLAALFVVAFLWRLAYLNRLDHSVLAGSLTLDSGIYWKWADFLRSHGLAGSNPFFLGPLYPYVLAGVRALVGDSMPAVLRVQALWGAAATTL